MVGETCEGLGNRAIDNTLKNGIIGGAYVVPSTRDIVDALALARDWLAVRYYDIVHHAWLTCLD